jgi:hypothetical protein
LKPTPQANSSGNPISKNPITQNGWWSVAQGAGPEFKPRNCKKIQVIIHLFMEMSQ